MQLSTTPSFSQTIWARWASRQFLTLPIFQTLLPVTFAYFLSTEAVVTRQLRRWKRLWRKSLTRSHKRTSMGPSRSCWNGTTSALLPGEDTSKGTRISCIDSISIKVPIRKNLETYLMIHVYICPVSWGCRIHWLHLCRGVSPPLTSVLDMTLNNLMVRFQQCWSFGECGVPLHCHCSQVHSGPEW